MKKVLYVIVVFVVAAIGGQLGRELADKAVDSYSSSTKKESNYKFNRVKSTNNEYRTKFLKNMGSLKGKKIDDVTTVYDVRVAGDVLVYEYMISGRQSDYNEMLLEQIVKENLDNKGFDTMLKKAGFKQAIYVYKFSFGGEFSFIYN